MERSWGFVGLIGLTATGVAIAMAWNFLTPPGRFDDLRAETLSISVIAPEMDDPDSALEMAVHHSVTSEWEYVTVEFAGATAAQVNIELSPGSVETGTQWYCATGIQAISAGSPEPFERIGKSDNTWAVGQGFDVREAWPAMSTIDRAIQSTEEGITCQRTGPIFVRKTQGLVLLAPAAIWAMLPANVTASLTEEMEVPPSWEMFGRSKGFATSERFSESMTEDRRPFLLKSSPERANQTDVSTPIGGLHLARDVVAESEEARWAWISALLGGAGIALMFATAEHLLRRPAKKHRQDHSVTTHADGGGILRTKANQSVTVTAAISIAILIATLLTRCRK